MKDYWTHLAEHARLAILRLLKDQPGYAANDSILTDAMAHLGLHAPRDFVRTQIGWLAEQGLVERRENDRLVIATVTRRGVDVAEGRALADGVKRPSP